MLCECERRLNDQKMTDADTRLGEPIHADVIARTPHPADAGNDHERSPTRTFMSKLEVHTSEVHHGWMNLWRRRWQSNETGRKHHALWDWLLAQDLQACRLRLRWTCEWDCLFVLTAQLWHGRSCFRRSQTKFYVWTT